MVEHKFVLFATVTALWSLETLLIKLIRILLKRNTYKTKIMPFWPICCVSDAILLKKFRPGDRAGVFIRENLHPGYRDIGRKKRVTSRDLGNRASPVDRADMKKP